MTEQMPAYGLWIDGAEAAAESGRTFTRENPYDGSVAGVFANADTVDTDRAIRSARRAFDQDGWSTSAARSRHDILARTAALIGREQERLAHAMTAESGKPIAVARGEVQGALKTFEYYAGAALAMEDSAIASRSPGALGMILKEPVGVAALITPWNFPLLNPTCKIAPALAAGCTLVAKPSHLCAGPAVILGQLLSEAGLPAGVLNVVTSDLDHGATVGQRLASSDLIDKIAFTGSTGTGRAVMAAASLNNKHVSLELGGKSANIVFEDAPLEAAAQTAITAFCYNSGQQCSAGSRLLVQRSIYESFLDKVVAYAGQQVIGDPFDPATTMGPLVNWEQFERVRRYVSLGAEEGRLLAGGFGPGDQTAKPGLFIRPTIYADISPSARLAQEEVFGPVLAVIPFEDEDEAIAIANNSRYGLAGAVWTQSIDRALRVVRAVRTGKMFVNAYNSAGIDDMPHGGVKASGIGREFGKAGIEAYQQQKTVQIKLWA